jgi:hypothetical protein
MRKEFLSLGLFSGFLLQACGDSDSAKSKTNSVTVKMQNIDSATSLLLDALSPNGSALSLLEQPHVTQRSFNPVSFKFPIKQIDMFGTDVTGGVVYECAGTTATECLVDMADKDAVAALIKEPVAVTYKEGTTPKISRFEVQLNPGCGDGNSSFNVEVKGTMDVAGVTYYTTSTETGKVLTTDASKYSYVYIPVSTCMMSWQLPTEVAVDQADVAVSLFVTVRDVAWGNPASANNNPGCKSESSGAGSFVCLDLAVPYPYIGTADPKVESYKITDTDTGNLAVVHVATYQSQAIGAFTRAYFDGTAMGASNCKAGSWLKSLNKNSDGSFKFEIAEGNNQSFVLFPEFKMANHSGTCTNKSGTSQAYSAEKL